MDLLKIKYIIVGRGPAGRATARQMTLNGIPREEICIIEAGRGMEERSSLAKHLCNGDGGAALLSDRKLTGPPAGVNLLTVQNPSLIAESMNDITTLFKEVLPDYNVEVINDNYSDRCLRGPAEDVRDATLIEMGLRDGKDKFPTSVVFSSFTDARTILKATAPQAVDTLYLHSLAVDEEDGTVTAVNRLGSADTVFPNADTIVLATGRLGPMKNPIPHTAPPTKGRWECGFRIFVNGDLLPVNKHVGQHDPKLQLNMTVELFGKRVNVNFRSFCVCQGGYMAASRELITGTGAVHGSSSMSEFVYRYADAKEKGSFIPPEAGTNLGLLMRITDPETVAKLVVPDTMNEVDITTVPSFDAIGDMLLHKSLYNEEVVPIMMEGTKALLQQMCDRTDTNLDEHFAKAGGVRVGYPCVEGPGMFMPLKSEPYGLVDHKNGDKLSVHVVGDARGHVRGWLPSWIEGSIMGRFLAFQHHFKENLHTCQDPTAAMFSYHKVAQMGYDASRMAYDIQEVHHDVGKFLVEMDLCDLITSVQEYLPMRMTLEKPLDKVSDEMGVLWEIHCFILSTYQQKNGDRPDGLFYVDVGSMVDYMTVCNALTDHGERVVALMDLILDGLCPDRPIDVKEACLVQLDKTITNHSVRSCLLSLWQDGTQSGVPVLQSATKVKFVTAKMRKKFPDYDWCTYDATAAAVLAALQTMVFNKNLASRPDDCGAKVVRTKIECQQPGIVSTGTIAWKDGKAELPYCECHVKCHITEISEDTGKGVPVSTERKRELMYELVKSIGEGNGSGATSKWFHADNLALSTNLLKHPDDPKSQPFFITYRTQTPEQMSDARIEAHKTWPTEYKGYQVRYVPDPECICFDDNHALDTEVAKWFPKRDSYNPFI